MVSKAFAEDVPKEYAEYYLLHLLEAVCRTNMLWLQMGQRGEVPLAPMLYDSGVTYVPENGDEIWPDIPTILEAGNGDCEDLACYRVAELRVRRGVKCRPFIRWRTRSNGYRLYHVLVAINKRMGGFAIEDPSAKLGMLGDGE